MMDSRKLTATIILHGDQKQDVANYLGISRSSLSKKLHERGSQFTQDEIRKIKERYKLTAEDVDEIFFNLKVSC